SQGAGAGGNVADEHGGGAAGHSGDVVVFGEPETLVSPALDVLGQVHGVLERLRGSAALHDGGKVQYGKRHAGQIGHGGKAPGSHDNKAPEAGRLCNFRTVYRRLRRKARSTALLIRSIETANGRG